MTDLIRSERKGAVALLTLNRPDTLNALDRAILLAFEAAVGEVAADASVRALIVTGEGRAFAAGADIEAMSKMSPAEAEAFSRLGHRAFAALEQLAVPTIAAVNGFALGGGCELALACHFRVMSSDPKAKIGLTELNLGIIPAWGGTQRMTRLVGRSKALDLILFSRKVDAHEALALGLVDKVSAPGELMNDAVELAGRLAERPPLAVACVLKAVAAGLYGGIDEGLEVEREGSRMLAQTSDAREGIIAFLEKRQPEFKGE
jgi:enoyl-CoA hydratase/carnithine racemase